MPDYDVVEDGAVVSPPEQMYAALKVLTETDHIANYLAVHDPKAMEQANRAMTAYEASTEGATWVEVPVEVEIRGL